MSSVYSKSYSERAIARLYQEMGVNEQPAIVWCESPFQLWLLPVLMPLFLSESGAVAAAITHPDPRLRVSPGRVSTALIERTTRGQTSATSAPDLLWNRIWCQIEEQIECIRWKTSSVDLGAALIPETIELGSVVSDAIQTSASAIIRADLNRRFLGRNNLDGERADPIVTQIRARLRPEISDGLSQQLVDLYRVSETLKTRPVNLADFNKKFGDTLLTTNLQFLLDNIVFASLGNEACACILFKHVCFAMKRPEFVYIDREKRLHSHEGPAIKFSDGYSIFAVEGTIVPRQFVEQPDWLTYERISDESNQERKRIYIKRYGVERFLQESNAELVAHDAFGSLYRVRLPNEDPIVFVRVINSTPEPDGSFREYFLRVHPYVQTPREAVAWTFGLREEEYRPKRET